MAKAPATTKKQSLRLTRRGRLVVFFAVVVALFAAMMRQCRPGHEGADFTLQASTQILLGGFVGAASGVLAKALGYDGLFVCAGVLGLAALLLVGRYFRRHGWR